MFDMDNEILEALEGDMDLNLKTKGSGAKRVLRGRCPDCNRSSLWIKADKPWYLNCDHEGSCGFNETVKQRYPELWENLGDRFPATESDPKATAKAYMKIQRGFENPRVSEWYEQGVKKLQNGQAADTVRFYPWGPGGMYWERIIDKSHVRIAGRKANFHKQSANQTYSSKHWAPPPQEINPKDVVYIVEGIFHSIAMFLAGYKSAAAFTCGNLPRELINEHKGKKVTWRLAYDDEPGAHKHIKEYAKEIRSMGEKVDIVLTGSKSKDWDDVYRDGGLDDKYILQCLWRGRIFVADTAKHRAYAMFGQARFYRTVFEFKSNLYSAKFSQEEFNKGNDNGDFVWGESWDEFNRACTVDCISNCIPNFTYVQQDKLTEERLYFFTINKANDKRVFRGAFSPNALTDPRAFNLALMSNTPGATFDGGAGELKILRQRWLNRIVPEVQTIPYLGFDSNTGAYIFRDFGYYKGKELKVNEFDYLSIDDVGIKTTLRDIALIHSTEFDDSWLPDFIKVFEKNGIASLAYFTASLFARQIKQKHQAFTFLELTGDAGAGKSTLLRFLWRLFGRENFEGIDLQSTSAASYGRHLGKVSNMPVVLIESDRQESKDAGGRPSKSVDWDVFKKVYDLDGVIDSRGVKTNDNTTNDRIFLGTLVFSQNDTVKASEAMLSRIVHLHASIAQVKRENRNIADRLKQTSSENLAGYLHQALTNEEAFIEKFFSSFDRHRADLTENSTIIHDRIVDCHAQVMAAVEALQVLLPSLPESALLSTFKYLKERGEDRQRRLSSDHPVIEQFWDTYHFLNDQLIHIDDENGERDIETQRLNHAKGHGLIAINLNEYVELCRKRGQELTAISMLKELLPRSQRYKFVEGKKVRSRITGGLVRCWVFSMA